MNDRTVCPNCSTDFDIDKNLKYQVKGFASLTSIFAYKRSRRLGEREADKIDVSNESNIVICPNCGNEFLYEEYKYFGFLSPLGLKVVIIIFLLFFITIPLYSIISTLING